MLPLSAHPFRRPPPNYRFLPAWPRSRPVQPRPPSPSEILASVLTVFSSCERLPPGPHRRTSTDLDRRRQRGHEHVLVRTYKGEITHHSSHTIHTRVNESTGCAATRRHGWQEHPECVRTNIDAAAQIGCLVTGEGCPARPRSAFRGRANLPRRPNALIHQNYHRTRTNESAAGR